MPALSSRGSRRQVAATKDYIKQFPAGKGRALRGSTWVFLGDVGVEDGQLTAEQCRLLKGLGGTTRRAAWSSCRAGRGGGALARWKPSWAISVRSCSIQPQPGGWGARVANHFELTELGRRSLPAPNWRTRKTTTPRCGEGLAELSVGRTCACGPRPVAMCSPSIKTRPTSMDGFPSWRRAPSAPARCFSWGPTAPGGGVKGLKTSITIGSGVRWCGWMAYQRRNMAKGETMRLYYVPDQPKR